MTKLSKTKRVLSQMLKKNTGTAMCDSGGYYGRHWQRNQDKDFEKMPRSVVEFRVWKHDGKVKPEIMVTHNIYHWLESRLEYCPEMDKLFHGRYVKKKDPHEDLNWFELLNEFPEWLKTLKDRSRQLKYENVTDFYGDGEPTQRYTYNEDNCLSQDINYLYFEIEDSNYVALMVHGGCDARGGFTKPRFFEVNDSCSELPMFDSARASIYCSKDEYHPTVLAIKQKQEDDSQLLLPGFNKPIGIAFDLAAVKEDFDPGEYHLVKFDLPVEYDNSVSCQDNKQIGAEFLGDVFSQMRFSVRVKIEIILTFVVD